MGPCGTHHVQGAGHKDSILGRGIGEGAIAAPLHAREGLHVVAPEGTGSRGDLVGGARPRGGGRHAHDKVELVGPQRVVAPYPPVTGSEDCAYFLQHRPGCFFRLGNGEEGARLHNPKYDFNDDILTTGAAYWTRLVQRYLGD